MNAFQRPIIHESAVVAPDAHLGPGVIIGPKVFIESGVRIGAYSVIGGMPEHKGFYSDVNQERSQGVFIRRDARIFEFVTIHAGTLRPTFIGEQAAIFNHSHIAHDCEIAATATIGGQVTLAGHVVVFSGAIVSGKAAVHQWCCIGSYAMIGAAAFVKAHVPPGETWLGNPARPSGINEIGLQRAGLTLEQVPRTAFDLLTTQRKL